jgi:hypothetical protein
MINVSRKEIMGVNAVETRANEKLFLSTIPADPKRGFPGIFTAGGSE